MDNWAEFERFHWQKKKAKALLLKKLLICTIFSGCSRTSWLTILPLWFLQINGWHFTSIVTHSRSYTIRVVQLLTFNISISQKLYKNEIVKKTFYNLCNIFNKHWLTVFQTIWLAQLSCVFLFCCSLSFRSSPACISSWSNTVQSFFLDVSAAILGHYVCHLVSTS